MDHLISISFFLGISIIIYFIFNQKEIVFKNHKNFKFTNDIKEEELRKLLLKVSKNEQLSISIPNENEEESKNMLIQKNRIKKEMILVCYTARFYNTEWKNYKIDEIVKLLIKLSKKSKTVEIQFWSVMKKAKEGKTFGDY